jgi:hypothetical protein
MHDPGGILFVGNEEHMLLFLQEIIEQSYILSHFKFLINM